ncbi:gamma-glutamylcyclotransferase [Microbacterium gubbeenense]|uniref:gamma-glutamylcyclotransferase n=1 Tax=Microbacterium gubbeenense TaxID=159896 RepID=UPI000427E2AF|nr:gamma-glutamylcyclotransferase [Microbacterium gubbeenense]
MPDETLTDPYAASSAPRAHPLTYPGTRPAASVVITHDAIWEICDREGGALAWQSDHLQRLPTCRVALTVDEREKLRLSRTAFPHLSSVLEEAYGYGPDTRVPVLAIGSNAAPSQMRHKFATTSVPLVVPSIRARVEEMTAGFSSFVSPLGYVPATLVPEPGAVAEMSLQLLDDQQLREIDRTESPAYRRVWVETPIQLETGERLFGAYAYVSRDGYLADDDGPWVMASEGQTRPDSVSPERWFADQSAVLARVSADAGVAAVIGSTPEEIVTRRADPVASTAALRAGGFVRDDNPLWGRPDEIGGQARRYGSLIDARIVSRNDDGTVVAIAGRSNDFLERRGRSVVRLGAAMDEALGHPKNVELVAEALQDVAGARAPRAVATVLRDDDGDAIPDEAIELDHVLRMGLGIEAGEEVRARKVTVKRPRWADKILGPPNSLTLRVTLADTSSTERDVCLMSRLSLQLLGVASGDYVVLEGGPDANGVVSTLAVKAFEVPEDVQIERERVSNGIWGARFPGVRETIGVWPDIPTVFVDASTRARLGIAPQQLGTLRARPARLQQFGSELREMMLLLAVALIGVVTIVPSMVLALALIGALVVGTFALTVAKLRRRLSHPRQRA